MKGFFNLKNITQSKLIVIVSLFLVVFYNYSFFTNTLEIYPLTVENSGFLFSLGVVLTAFIVVLLTLLSSQWTTKPIIIIIFIVSSLTTYFMNTYHVVIDESMIQNTMQTNMKESMDLLSLKQVLYFVLLGILPSYLVYKTRINYRPFKVEVFAKLKLLGISLFVMVVLIFIFSKYYTSFAREHKPLRYYTNPTYWIYSIGKYINLTVSSGPIDVQAIGLDAKTVTSINAPKKLTIMVVGEAARADRFSLNGYSRETNPLLKKENIVNFSKMYSCGTSTAESVPCMFSVYDRGDYSYKKGISTENVLDVLTHTNEVEVLWRDNNSDSKGVAIRNTYEDFKTAKNNTICEADECRDEGMLVGLDGYIKTHPNKNILIVLHQMGNHGPAYYKRYPKSFEKFTPVCQTNQLEECTQEEIGNAYDNAILYTDYFLAKTINFLKPYSKSYQTTMIYMSDHGESLGENGLYLHGLPYFMAPDAQTHIGAFIWFGENNKKEVDANKEYSQDNLFHTLLGVFDVKSEVYNRDMDILK